MSVQFRSDYTNKPIILGGYQAIHKDNETFLQDASRSTDLLRYTACAQIASSRKWVPLTDVNPALTAGTLVCGAYGANLAATQAVTDGEFTITVNGTVVDITGLDFSAIASLVEIPDVINAAAVGSVIAYWDSKTAAVTFVSPTAGVNSTLSVLAAVSGGAGTDISGAGFINGLAGTLAAGTGGDGSDIPCGVYAGPDIASADLVAGDVTERVVIVGGAGFSSDVVVFENSLTLNSVVVSRTQTVEEVFNDNGIYFIAAADIAHFENA